MMEFYACSDRRAKKEHKCDFCNKTIRPGEKYSYEKGKYDGEFFTRKLCNICTLALSMYLYEVGEDEFDWWAVSDWLSDEICSKCSESVKDECNGIPERCELGRMRIVKKWEGVIDSLQDWKGNCMTDAEEWHIRQVIGDIKSLPAADVKPVRWTPVEERLPETDKLVLVVKSDGDMAVAVWNAALGWLHYWSGSRVKNVTHWMPLPEPPNKRRDNA